MLTHEEEEKNTTLLRLITEEIEGKDTYTLLLGDIQWLAEKLKWTNAELKVANIYSSAVSAELRDLQKRHHEVDKMLQAALLVLEETKNFKRYYEIRKKQS